MRAPGTSGAAGTQRAYTRAIERQAGAVIPYVFHRAGRPIKSFRKAWASASHRAGLVGMLPPDFRRTAREKPGASRRARSVAMNLVGHKTEAMYRRYAIVSPRDLTEGVAKLATLREAAGNSGRKLFGHNRAQTVSEVAAGGLA